MFTVFFGLALLFAAFDWVAAGFSWRRVRWLTKPAALLLLIAWFSQVSAWQGVLIWFGLGLIFSLGGDILLMLPERFFLAGVGAFFAAHLMYIIGFSQSPLLLRWEASLPLLLVAGAFTGLNGQVRAGVQRKHENALLVPVMIYAATLSLMWLMALSTLFRVDWMIGPAVLACVGGTLFFISDSILAMNRFVRPISHADLLVMVTYHLGQFLLAAGAITNYASF